MASIENMVLNNEISSNFEIEDEEDENDHYRISDNFKLISILGEGMFGKVYCAFSYIDKKKVALKMIKKKDFPQDKLGLLRYEESIVSQLDHPNIIHFYMVSI